MIGLVTGGFLDASLLVPLQVFQTWIMILVKATWAAEFAPQRLSWSPELDHFIYTSEIV